MPGNPSGPVPAGIHEAITADLADRGLEADAIGPAEPTLSRAGEHEQVYVATVRGAPTGKLLLMYEAEETGGEWEVSFVKQLRG